MDLLSYRLSRGDVVCPVRFPSGVWLADPSFRDLFVKFLEQVDDVGLADIYRRLSKVFRSGNGVSRHFSPDDTFTSFD